MSDFDGDLVMTTDSQQFLDGVRGGLPISYSKKMAEKVVIDEELLWNSDMAGMNSRVGFITNLSSTYHCLLNEFSVESKEHKVISNRLKLLRFHQGQEIDKQKGILIDDFPDNWAKWSKKKDDMTKEEMEEIDFNNSILAEKRPYFMRYLYDNYNKEYLSHLSKYDNYSITQYGLHLSEILLKKDLNKKQKEFINKFHRYNPLIVNDSVMNRICKHMESQIKEVKQTYKNKEDFDFSILLDKNSSFDSEKFKQVMSLFERYKIYKANMSGESGDGISQFSSYIRRKAIKEISSDECELASLAVRVCYQVFPNSNKDFCWKVFPDGLIENIRKNSLECPSIPLLKEDGDIEYLGKFYRMVEVEA